MSTTMLEIIKQADGLSVSDQIELAVCLMELAKARVTQLNSPAQTQHKWREIRGRYAGLLNGEDAQVWVNRLREEWDEREAQWSARP